MDSSIPLSVYDALVRFPVGKPVISLALNHSGHINDTYTLLTKEGHFVLQRLNRTVFKDVDAVMGNMSLVTSYLGKVILQRGGNPERETLHLLPTSDGQLYYVDREGGLYRCMRYIEGGVSFVHSADPIVLFEAGRILAQFEKDLDRFPMKKLQTTIPDFHATDKRLAAFVEALHDDPCSRAEGVTDEIAGFLRFSKIADPLPELPLRVTHNDSKLTNVMFDASTHKALALIDLDTVMPGYSIFDFGDAVRYDCSSAEEGEKDLDKVHFLLDSYKAFLQGYLSIGRDILTKEELACLSLGAERMTYECGLRFLTDYLLGDHYFRVSHETENLERARTQLKLVSEMNEKRALMDSFVE